jgi:hypothetical protein
MMERAGTADSRCGIIQAVVRAFPRNWSFLSFRGGNLLYLSDVTGIVARSDKLVNRAEQLLGGEVYHYHTKFIMKEAHTGGSFVWYVSAAAEEK